MLLGKERNASPSAEKQTGAVAHVCLHNAGDYLEIASTFSCNLLHNDGK